jgi:chromosome segregation ATPase
MNEKRCLVFIGIVVAIAVVIFSATTIIDRLGRRTYEGVGLRTAAEAEYQRLESDLNRATATIDGIEDGLGRIERIAYEIEVDNDGAIGAIRTAIEIVEEIRSEVAVMERSIDNFRNHYDNSSNTMER